MLYYSVFNIFNSTGFTDQGRRKKNILVANMSVNEGGGGINPLSETNQVFFKLKKMQNVLKRRRKKYFAKTNCKLYSNVFIKNYGEISKETRGFHSVTNRGIVLNFLSANRRLLPYAVGGGHVRNYQFFYVFPS